MILILYINMNIIFIYLVKLFLGKWKWHLSFWKFTGPSNNLQSRIIKRWCVHYYIGRASMRFQLLLRLQVKHYKQFDKHDPTSKALKEPDPFYLVFIFLKRDFSRAPILLGYSILGGSWMEAWSRGGLPCAWAHCTRVQRKLSRSSNMVNVRERPPPAVPAADRSVDISCPINDYTSHHVYVYYVLECFKFCTKNIRIWGD